QSAPPLLLHPFPTRRSSDLGGVVFGEAARGPEQTAVPFALTQGCNPSAESLHIKTFTRCHLVSVGKCGPWVEEVSQARRIHRRRDRKSTRLNSSHVSISYAG